MAIIDTTTNDSQAQVSVTTHRLYDEMINRWDKISDCLQDEYQIKLQGEKYLPKPSGIKNQKDPLIQKAQYDAYKERAVYYSYLPTTIGAMMGLLTRKPINIQVPERIQSIIELAGYDGDNIYTVVNRVLENQLSYSRYGILLDVPKGSQGTEVVPMFAEYLGDKIVNWVFDIVHGRETLVALVLNESYYDIGQGFNEKYVEEYRICALDYKNAETGEQKEDPVYYTYKTNVAGVNSFTPKDTMPEDAIVPTIVGKSLNYIPFQPFNALSLEMSPEIPVLMQLVDISIAIYRGEADYRSSLFMQGQATPYVFGVSDKDDVMFGANTLLTNTSNEIKAGFLEVSGNGLQAQKDALNDLHKRASEQGVSLIEGGSQQSGEALNIRVGVKTASLSGVAKANAMGFENLLKWAAEWCGSNVEDVSVIANTDFSDASVSLEELIKLTTAVEKGLFRLEDLYNWLVKQELTNAEDFATWKDELQNSQVGIPEFVMQNMKENKELSNEQI